jgi:RNA polymerase sigma-70 factor (ECF subfamily)
MDPYERYGRALLRKAERILGDREDARDVVQGLFADLHGAPERRLVDLPYLYRAVTNRCLTLLRDATNRARLLGENDDGESEVLMYRYLDDMTQEEIAALLGLSRKTIGKRLDRIREAVRRITGEVAPGGAEP